MVFHRIVLPVLVASLWAAPAAAHESGDLLARFGLLTSQPDTGEQKVNFSTQDQELEVAEDTVPGFSVSYMFNEYLAAGFGMSLPLEHNLLLNEGDAGSGNVGEFSVVSPNASVEFHAPALAGFSSYLGLGVHYSAFFEEDIRNRNARQVPASYRLQMDSTTGFVARLGVDYDVGSNWFVSASVSQFAVESATEIRDGSGSIVQEEDIELDPLQLQMGVAHRF